MLLAVRKWEEIMVINLDNEISDKVLFIGKAFELTKELGEVKELTVIKLLILDQVNSYRKDKEIFIAKWKNYGSGNDKDNVINISKKNDDTKNEKEKNSRNNEDSYYLKLPSNINDDIDEIKEKMGYHERREKIITRIIIKGIRETLNNPYLSKEVIKDAQKIRAYFRDKIVSRYEEYFKMRRKEINVNKEDIIEWELMKIALKNVDRLDWKIEEEID